MSDLLEAREEELGEIRGVRLYGAYLDPETMTAGIGTLRRNGVWDF